MIIDYTYLIKTEYLNIDAINEVFKERGNWLEYNNSENNNPTFEGVVICDSNKQRWKVKSSTYLGLHKLRGENNIFNIQYLIPFILSDNCEELVSYFPEIKEILEKTKDLLDNELNLLNSLYTDNKNIISQKEFALNIINKTKLSSILFKARKENKTIEEIFRDSEDLLYKVLFKSNHNINNK